MTLPHGVDLGMTEHSPCHAVFGVFKYLHAHERAVYVGAVAVTANNILKSWGKKGTFMEGSICRFLRTGHVNSVPDYLPAGWTVTCGKDGVPRGHVRIYPPESPALQPESNSQMTVTTHDTQEVP